MEPLLKLSGVTKIYNSNGVMAVGMKSVTASFDIGEFVAVTGESGSGKSTLLNVLSGMDSYEEGAMCLAGEDISFYTEADREEYRRKYVSFVFQDYFIIDSYTAQQNVELALFNKYPDKKARRARALELLDMVGLAARAKHKGTKLSGGEKQRVSIARALAKDSPIIFADEPTGNLDSKSGAEILKLLSDAAADKLVIVVTHDYEELKGYATRRIRMFDGNLIEDAEVRKADKKDWAALFTQSAFESVKEDKTNSKKDFKNALKELPAALKVKMRLFFKSAGQLSEVALNDLLAAPKRSMFSLWSLVFMALVLILSLSGIETTKYYNVEDDSDRYSIMATLPRGGLLTDADKQAIDSIKGVSYSMDAEYDFSKIGCAIKGETREYDMMLYPAEIMSYSLAAGRMPVNNDEIVILVDYRDADKSVIGKTVDVDFYMKSNYYGGQVSLTRTYTITGYACNRMQRDITYLYFTYQEAKSICAEPVLFYNRSNSYNDQINEFLTEEIEKYSLKDTPAEDELFERTAYDNRYESLIELSQEFGYPFDEDYRAYVEEDLNHVLCVYFSKNVNPESIKAALEEAGYKGYYLYNDIAEEDNQTFKITVIIVFIIMAAFVTLLSVLALKGLAEIKKRDYAVMRAVGFPDGFMKALYLTEMLYLALAAVITAGVMAFVGFTIFNLIFTGGLAYSFNFLFDNALFLCGLFFKTFIADALAAMLMAAAFNRRFYKRSVKSSLIMED